GNDLHARIGLPDNQLSDRTTERNAVVLFQPARCVLLKDSELDCFAHVQSMAVALVHAIQGLSFFRTTASYSRLSTMASTITGPSAAKAHLSASRKAGASAVVRTGAPRMLSPPIAPLSRTGVP